MKISIEHYNAMAERIAYLDQKLSEWEWVPCSERLPEEYKEYLVSYTTDDGVGLIWLDSERESEAIVKKYNISAWMPLPEPWEGGAE